jgi:hypothetical protein
MGVVAAMTLRHALRSTLGRATRHKDIKNRDARYAIAVFPGIATTSAGTSPQAYSCGPSRSVLFIT